MAKKSAYYAHAPNPISIFIGKIKKFNEDLIMTKSFSLLLGLSAIFSAVLGGILFGAKMLSPFAIAWVVGYSVAMIAVSFVLCGIPAGIYWLFTREKMPGLNAAIWVLWGLLFAMSAIGNLVSNRI